MFTEFFFLLRAYGVPVSLTEWMTLLEALSRGLAFSSLTTFYYLARACLVKSEAYFDQYDQAFAAYFGGVQTSEEIAQRVWEWLAHPLPPPDLSQEELRRWSKTLQTPDLEELRRLFEERLRQQTEAHHGGSKWIGTGGTSPFGHSGFHPGGLRLGGEGHAGTAVKVAAERRFRGYRQDETLDVRQFELALRRLRQLTTPDEGPKDELDLEATVRATGDNGGFLELVWARGRRNRLKLLVLMDVGGSMTPYYRLCNQLFTAVHRAGHFRDLKFYYFHNCVYEHLYLDALCHPRHSEPTRSALANLNPDYRLILVGDACMAPSELTLPNGIIWWGEYNEEPGIEWLRRLARHFSHSVWLNPIPRAQWETTYGNETIRLVRQVFPMFELTLEGLGQAVKKLLVRH